MPPINPSGNRPAVLIHVPRFVLERLKAFGETTQAICDPDKLVKYFSKAELVGFSAVCNGKKLSGVPGVADTFVHPNDLNAVITHYMGTTRTISDVTVQALKSAAALGESSLATYFPELSTEDVLKWFMGGDDPMQCVPRIECISDDFFILTYHAIGSGQTYDSAQYWFYRNASELLHKYYGLSSAARTGVFHHYLAASAMTMAASAA